MGLFSQPNRVYSYRLVFLCSSLNAVLQSWLRYRLTWAAIKEETITRRSDAIPRTIEDHRWVRNIWIHASRHIIANTDSEEGPVQSRVGRGYWVTGICYFGGVLWFFGTPQASPSCTLPRKREERRMQWTNAWSLGSCHTGSNRLRAFDVMRVALLVKRNIWCVFFKPVDD